MDRRRRRRHQHCLLGGGEDDDEVGTVPASFDRQLQTLSRFYTKHDSAKAGAECRAILDKRRGDADAMSVSDFAKLCSKLQKKYGENPLDLPATAGAAAPAAAVDAAGVRSAPLVSRWGERGRWKRAGRSDRGGVIRAFPSWTRSILTEIYL
eukprot:COSAG01_NODE_12595_length_1713_cov_1.149318_3_plen_151_part_01